MSMQPNFGEREMATDLLHSQKAITGDYNTSANESAGCEVKNLFLSILTEEHSMQHDMFTCMQKRGWYPTEAAPMQKINEAKAQFSSK